jgi:hypothetical protein
MWKFGWLCGYFHGDQMNLVGDMMIWRFGWPYEDFVGYVNIWLAMRIFSWLCGHFRGDQANSTGNEDLLLAMWIFAWQ